MIIQLIILALALSIDALGIGISYGIRKIKISFLSISIISIISLLLSSIALFLGSFLASLLSKKITTFFSILILIFLGLFIIKKGLEKDKPKDVKLNEQNKIYSFFIRSLGITIKVIKMPSLCDFDNSLKIEPKEAFYLAMALSLDSVGTSIAISNLYNNIFIFPILVVFFQLNFLFFGILIGKNCLNSFLNEQKISIISGTILVFIALLRIIFYNF